MAEPDRLGGRRRAGRSVPLPIERGPEAQRLAQRERRLQRVEHGRDSARPARPRRGLRRRASPPRGGAARRRCAAGSICPSRSGRRPPAWLPAAARKERPEKTSRPPRTQARSRASTASGAKAPDRGIRKISAPQFGRSLDSGVGLPNPLYAKRPARQALLLAGKYQTKLTACLHEIRPAPASGGAGGRARPARGARLVQEIARHLQMPPHARCRRQDLHLFLAAGGGEERACRHFPPALLAEGAAGEPAPLRGRAHRQGRRHPRGGGMAEGALLEPRDRLPAGARADAGFHRRAGRGRPRRHARRHEQSRRRPAPHQSAGAGRSRHRPFGDGRFLRRCQCVREERRDGIRAQRRALHVPALGPGGLREFPRRAARHRHLPPGEPRISGPDGLDARRARGRRAPSPTPSPTRWSAPIRTPRW